ncbi:hypothetical protein tloyanaT_13420 [Thalassotalea loyana]|uniref:Uncharacterized protein n=1 Tax=Thalassotalea loyana TaxID=280483 RepID=A0ABQ6HEC4_9GAMM|nr:hypothetical protein tloyanaT_13420 [Thalassotalea loyana]
MIEAVVTFQIELLLGAGGSYLCLGQTRISAATKERLEELIDAARNQHEVTNVKFL